MGDGKTVIINLFGGPGSGKSTTAYHLASEFKMRGYNCELVTEFAKDKTYEENFTALGDQIYVFGKQHFKLSRIADKVDIIITDSPLLHSLIYNTDEDYKEPFENLVWKAHNKTHSINVFISRTGNYLKVGRTQTPEESDEISKEIFNKFSSIFDFIVDKNVSTKELFFDKLVDRINYIYKYYIGVSPELYRQNVKTEDLKPSSEIEKLDELNGIFGNGESCYYIKEDGSIEINKKFLKGKILFNGNKIKSESYAKIKRFGYIDSEEFGRKYYFSVKSLGTGEIMRWFPMSSYVNIRLALPEKILELIKK